MRNAKCGVRNKKISHYKTVIGVIISFFFYAGSVVYAENKEFQFKKQAEIQQVRPPKPVKIKVHRNGKGEYSWELNGDNVDELAAVDRKLRKTLRPD